MASLTIGDKRLGAALLESELVKDEDLQRAIEEYRELGGSLAEVILDLGLLSERQMAQVIEEIFGIPLVSLTELEIPPEVLALIPAERAQELRAIPFAREGNTLRVALLNPLDNLTIEELEDLTGLVVEPYQTTRSEFQYALAKYYPELGLSLPAQEAPVEDLRLGELLVRHGWLDPKQLEEALKEQQKTGDALGRILLKQGFSEERLYQALAEQAGLEFVADPSRWEPEPEVNALFLRSDALRYRAIPLRQEGEKILVLLADPRHQTAVREALGGRPARLVLTTPKAWERLFERLYPERSRLGELLVKEHKLDREALQEALKIQRKTGNERPLGETLVALGYVKPEDVEEALAKQRQGGGRLEDTLVQSGKVKPEVMAKAMATQLGVPYIDPLDQPPDPSVVSLIPEHLARRHHIFPHHRERGALVILMKDPRNFMATDDVKMITRMEVLPAVSTESAILKLIERYYRNTGGLEELTKEFEKKQEDLEPATASVLDDNAVVRLVNSIIREAYLQDASDIHIEPTPHDVLVRIRVDGSLREYQRLPKGAAPSIVSRIKIMGKLDIAERRLPQDGRVVFRDRSVNIDLRLSTLPTVYGEKVVMRLLRKSDEIPEIEGLGFAPTVFERFRQVIERPYGIFLITGPTGSGKSFTTFSILKRIATPDKNTLTIEDPVEYEIPGINQTQVNAAAGLDFARALRSFLRQDPDIIMVGEIRDTETAKIAVEAALTGHLVIATLHTNDAAGAITRLDEMGVELFNISASLLGVLAQRLVRRVCDHCKVPVEPDPRVLRNVGLTLDDLEGKTLYRGTGCERCNGTGYRGRYAIHELMVIDDEIRKAIVERRPATEIKELARRGGMKTLREDGLYKALEGITTLEEVMARTME
jgi:type IV pilus assembly protein PilB